MAARSNGEQQSLKRVSVVEDDKGDIHMRNLSMHLVTSEEAALNLLFLGDTNRAVNETAMNPNSSRSHWSVTLGPIYYNKTTFQSVRQSFRPSVRPVKLLTCS